MNFQRKKYREGSDFDPCLIFQLSFICSGILLFIVGLIQPDPFYEPEKIAQVLRGKESLLTDLLTVFLFSGWLTAVFLAAINVDWDDFRAALKWDLKKELDLWIMEGQIEK